MKNLTTSITVAGLSLLLAVNAQGVSTAALRLSDGSTTIEIADGSLLDTNSEEGVVSYNGGVGVFQVAVSTGLTKPAYGSVGSPMMHLDHVNLSSEGAGVLEVSFSEIGFIPTGGATGVRMGIGGLTSGVVSYEAFADPTPGNSLFTNGTPGAFETLEPTPNGFGVFGGASAFNVPDLSYTPFSLTQVVTITHARSGFNVTSFDADLSVPDGGATVGLLGLALLSLGVGRRLLHAA